MKSAYELAMERLEGSAPAPKLTDNQRAAMAEIDERFRSKIAEKEVFLTDLIAKAQFSDNPAEVLQLEVQLNREISRLREACESEKEKLRAEWDQA